MTTTTEIEGEEYFGVNPKPGMEYPFNMQYCGNCTMPFEYCEFYQNYDSCKDWIEKNLPHMFEALVLSKQGGVGSSGGRWGEGGEEGGDEKKRQKRGGKGRLPHKKKEEGPKKVVVFTAPRGKKKTTVVMGLKTFDLELKVCSKLFGQKFACGSSVTAPDEIVLQGDIKDDLIDFIQDHWPQIDDDSIEDGGEHKR